MICISIYLYLSLSIYIYIYVYVTIYIYIYIYICTHGYIIAYCSVCLGARAGAGPRRLQRRAAPYGARGGRRGGARACRAEDAAPGAGAARREARAGRLPPGSGGTACRSCFDAFSLLLTFDKRCPAEEFQATVSQSTVLQIIIIVYYSYNNNSII